VRRVLVDQARQHDFDGERVMTTRGAALLAYDGSPSSATAIAVAGQLLRGRVAVVCHVWSGISQAVFRSPPSALPGVLSDAAEELDEFDSEAARKVAAEGVALARSAGFNAEPLAERREKKAWRSILHAAERDGASVVVAGAHGLSGVGRAILGSVSTGLVHHSTIPVLVVPATATEESLSGPPLLCYDGSDGSKRAIRLAGDLLSARHALVGHFWESWVAEAPALAGVSATVQGMAAELDEIADEQSSERTTDGVHVAEAAGFDATGVSKRATGPVWRAILDAADEHECSSIVVGSRGLTGVSAALGSVSNGVVHHSRRPVLVIPPGATA
jgi:nucleotide-binding universal stress UspA family protein